MLAQTSPLPQYATPVFKGAKPAEADATTGEGEKKQSNHVQRILAERKLTAKIEPALESRFKQGRLFAVISSRPGQSGRCDGYVLEGKELEVSCGDACFGGASPDICRISVLPAKDEPPKGQARRLSVSRLLPGIPATSSYFLAHEHLDFWYPAHWSQKEKSWGVDDCGLDAWKAVLGDWASLVWVVVMYIRL